MSQIEFFIKTINPEYTELIQKIRELEKQFKWYLHHAKTKLNYNLENEDDFDNQVIEGESTLDIILDLNERSNSLFDLMFEIFKELNKIKTKENKNRIEAIEKAIKQCFRKRLFERQLLEKRISKILEHLNQSQTKGFLNESEYERNEIMKINNDMNKFKMELENKKINTELKFGIRAKDRLIIQKWTGLTMRNTIFDSNIHSMDYQFT